ncbi:MAG: 4-alpha-glucanotransferase [Bacteroidetes bacterium]|nr:MAG: 4-alpha-glucanotransferase [Bacteroidota bacterium]
MNDRASGILLHPTSLPGNYGIGTLGKAAFDCIDFLALSKQRYWQILPLGPTGYADSPYQCFSAHAGNPNLIDLELLVDEGLLQAKDLATFPSFGEGPVQFDEVQNARKPLLQKAYEQFSRQAGETEKLKYRNFLKEHYKWLNDFALFMAIKNSLKLKPWLQWDRDIRHREPDALKKFQDELKEETAYYKFLQYLFFRQWTRVKAYAHRKKLRIIGDIPLYVALDSADAWANSGLFEFDKELKPVRVGGVPPDYFSETGQLWGNPLFRWTDQKVNVCAWWRERIATNLFLFDIVRIDHFRGFAAYWVVPYGEKTAVNGKWIDGPGKEFFDDMLNHFGQLPIIAEDLGVITPDVEELRDSYGFPGMKILEFAFDSEEANDYIPYNFSKNCLVYTGTHDNDTVRGWFASLKPADKEFLLEYLNTPGTDINWDLIRLAWSSVANTAIVPMQDLIGLDSSGRMNVPGTTTSNWRWRAKSSYFTPELAERLAKLTILYGRATRKK